MDEIPIARIRSFAKINWYLRILSRRSDDFHNIDSLVQLISLYDEITISRCSSGDQVSCNYQIPTGEASLLGRLLAGWRKQHPACRNHFFSIAIRKMIPLCGGLGGGSSNTASLMNALNSLNPDGLSLNQRIEFSASLGSDIPFFASEYRLARVEGRGDRITEIPPPAEYSLVLGFPGFGIPTQWAFQEWDRRASHLQQLNRPVFDLDAHQKQKDVFRVEDWIWNDFEEVVFPHYPFLVTLKNILLDEGCSHSFLSGSGSTVVGVVRSSEEASCIVERLRARGIRAVAASTRLPGGCHENLPEPERSPPLGPPVREDGRKGGREEGVVSDGAGQIRAKGIEA